MNTRIATDVLIIGDGGAGATAAIEASKNEKLVITIATKGHKGKSGATVTGGADLSVDSKTLSERFPWLRGTDPQDSQGLLFEDTVRGGKYLNNQRMVEIQVKEAPERLKDLVDWGVGISEVLHCSGHTYPRGVFIPGIRLVPVLMKKIKEAGVTIVEDTMVTDLLLDDGRIAGAVGLNMRNGDFTIFDAKAVIIAAGGCQRIYPITSAPEELTGDGLAMAYRAGVELMDMEFPMFIPGGFVWPSALLGIVVPYVLSTTGRYGPGHLLNRYGERFMERWAPKTMEHSTRDICSVAMMTEILEGRGSKHGGVYVSLKHLPDNLIDFIHEWQAPEELWKYGGAFDLDDFIPRDSLKREALEAVPASHFFNGGIRISERCETNVAGVFAAGEATAGVHGGNRLSGNAFAEMVVWGTRAGRYAAEYAEKSTKPEIDEKQVERLQRKILQPLEREKGTKPLQVRKTIQDLAWEKVGVVRDGPVLNEAIQRIKAIREKGVGMLYTESKEPVWNREWVEALQIENMLLCLEAIARAALARKESRAAHYRKDFLYTDYLNWTRNIVIKLVDGEMQLRTEPVVVTRLHPPAKVVPYGSESQA